MGLVVWALNDVSVWLRIAAGALTYGVALLATGGFRLRGGVRLSV